MSHFEKLNSMILINLENNIDKKIKLLKKGVEK